MNIEIEFVGFPLIYDLYPAGLHPYTFSGQTLPELVADLITRHGNRLKESLLDPRTLLLDSTIQVMFNHALIPKEELARQKIGEGDQITFLKLLAGG
jgi:sulfur carrier protein ThiS